MGFSQSKEEYSYYDIKPSEIDFDDEGSDDSDLDDLPHDLDLGIMQISSAGNKMHVHCR
jgi:hypothetical protein